MNNNKAQYFRKIAVDNGYVELYDCMGDDLSVANAARTSYDKVKSTLDQKDTKLIQFLAEHKHMSPFRHVQFAFRIHTTESVMRQFYKHQVGCGWTSEGARYESTVWNEVSFRYLEYADDFYNPKHRSVYMDECVPAFRKQHPTNKQASLEGIFVEDQSSAAQIYTDTLNSAYKAYKDLIALGVCKEQARLVLPTSFMTTVCWTTSLEAATNFIRLRDHDGAQLEIRKLAQAIGELIFAICPISVQALIPEVSIMNSHIKGRLNRKGTMLKNSDQKYDANGYVDQGYYIKDMMDSWTYISDLGGLPQAITDSDFIQVLDQELASGKTEHVFVPPLHEWNGQEWVKK